MQEQAASRSPRVSEEQACEGCRLFEREPMTRGPETGQRERGAKAFARL